MRRLFLVLAVLVCAVAFVGCGTDNVLAPETNNAVMTSEAVSQPFVLDTTEADSTIVTTETTAPATDPPPKKKKDPPPEPPKVEEATWGELKARYR